LATKAPSKKSKKASKANGRSASARRPAPAPKKKAAKPKPAKRPAPARRPAAPARRPAAKKRPKPAAAKAPKRKKVAAPKKKAVVAKKKPAKKLVRRPAPEKRPAPKLKKVAKAAAKKRPVKPVKAPARKPVKEAPRRASASPSRPPPSSKAAKKALKGKKLAAKEAPVREVRKSVPPPPPPSKKGKALPPPSKKGKALPPPPPPPPSKKGKAAPPPPPPPPSKKGKAPLPPPPPPPSKKGKGAPPPAEPPRPSGKPGKGSLGKAAPPPGKAEKRGRDSGRPSAPPRRPEPRAALREPPRVAAIPLPTIAPPKRLTMEERAALIEKRLAEQTDDFRKRYNDSFLMSWIYHDAALEGVVYTYEELRGGLTGQVAPNSDSGLQPTYDDIRRTKEAVEYVRDLAEKKRLPITVDVIKKLYLILHPEEGDIKTVKYRKDIPQHRLYFHEYAPPDKIAYKIRQIVDWLNDPETRKTRNLVRIAARVHYDLLRVYPFPTDSGKVARLFMNLMLTRGGMPPAIVHSTERQRYYEALKGSANTVLQMVQESVENSLASVEKLLDEHESRKRAFIS